MEKEIEILKEKIIALQKEINQKDNELAELIKFNEDKTLIHIIDEKDYYKEAYNNQLKKNCELKEQIVLSESILVKMKRELSCALNCDLSSDTSGKTPVTGITEDIIIKKLSALEHEILQLKKEDFCGASLSDSLLSSIEMCFDKQTTEIIELILEKINSNPSLQKNIASCGSLPKNVKIADAAPGNVISMDSSESNKILGEVLLVAALIFILIVLYFERDNINSFNMKNSFLFKIKTSSEIVTSVKVDEPINNLDIAHSSKKYIDIDTIAENVPVKPVTKESESATQNSNIDTNSNAATEPVLPETSYVLPDFFVIEDNVESSFTNAVYQYYLYTPENIRVCFQQCGGKIIIVNNLGYLGFSEQVLETNQDTIKIDNREKAKSAILHEMGHFVGYYCGSIHDTQEFYNVWQSEVNTFKNFDKTDDANTNTPKEYFAESFYYTIMHPDIMASNCPQTYNYIMTYINSI